MNKTSQYKLTRGTVLYDRRYKEEVYVARRLNDNRLLLRTELDVWKDSTDYGITLPLDKERFKIIEQ